MPTTFTIDHTNIEPYQDANLITDLQFGSIYTTFFGFGRFEDQLSEGISGLITWPGGFLAERYTDRYGMEHEGLYALDNGKPGLSEMLEFANDNGSGFSLVIPTFRYEGNEAGFRSDLRDFMGDLLGGTYGVLPETTILQIGSEYYAHFGEENAATYGNLANIAIEEIRACIEDPMINTTGFHPMIAVQMGRSPDADTDIRATIDNGNLADIDLLITHRFTPTADSVDWSIDRLRSNLDAWEQEMADVGVVQPDLFFSAYGVQNLTRNDALSEFIEDRDGSVTAQDIDLAGRTNDDFESFWQRRLSEIDYGPDHPRAILEMFSEYSQEGVFAGSAFGTDSSHPGRLSIHNAQGESVQFIPQDMLDMLQEATVGTVPVDIGYDNEAEDPVWGYAFENDDYLVVFMAHKDTPDDTAMIELSANHPYIAVYADQMTGAVPDDWMEQFGVIDNPTVDETPESETFTVGVRAGKEVLVEGTRISFDITDPNAVVRIAFAKTQDGIDEIESWENQGPGQDITSVDDAHENPDDLPNPGEDDTTGPQIPTTDDSNDDSGGFDFAGMLIPLVGILALLGALGAAG